jgi:hypothetical protein
MKLINPSNNNMVSVIHNNFNEYTQGLSFEKTFGEVKSKTCSDNKFL